MMFLLMVIVLNWNKISCVDTFSFFPGVMFAQNFDNTIDRPIYYASQLMSNVEKNYFATKKEALIMIYVVKKFWL